MPKSLISLIKFYALPALVALVVVIVALRFVDPPPPRTIVFVAGQPGGAYWRTAEAFRDWIAPYGVTVTIEETAGSVENLARLAAGNADVGLVQAGLAGPEKDDLRALGALFPEPLWVFVREGQAEDFAALSGLRVAIGAPGSGTRALVETVRAQWGGTWPEAASQPLSGVSAKDALLRGDVDAALFVAGVDAAYVGELARAPGIRLLPFGDAPALARRIPYLSQTPLLAGVMDIGAGVPAVDTPLIATSAMLTVSRETHPAIQALLLDAAHELYRGGTLLSPPGAFPSRDLVDLPLSKEAARYYERGPSVLRRMFPFGVANFLERAWVLAIPLLTLVIPLIRIAPPVYRWRIRRKIYIWYRDLRALEAEGRAAKDNVTRAAVMDRLAHVQAETGRIEVPLSYTDDLYRLRNHVSFVYDLLARMQAGHGA